MRSDCKQLKSKSICTNIFGLDWLSFITVSTAKNASSVFVALKSGNFLQCLVLGWDDDVVCKSNYRVHGARANILSYVVVPRCFDFWVCFLFAYASRTANGVAELLNNATHGACFNVCVMCWARELNAQAEHDHRTAPPPQQRDMRANRAQTAAMFQQRASKRIEEEPTVTLKMLKANVLRCHGEVSESASPETCHTRNSCLLISGWLAERYRKSTRRDGLFGRLCCRAPSLLSHG